jgi:hypothetical protein
MNQPITTISGKVQGFERTTQVSGTTQRTSTTHLSLFRLGTERMILRSSVPSMISEGDDVVVAGIQSDGQFTGLACKNQTTGWVTPLVQQGCIIAFLIVLTVISFAFFFVIFPIVFGIIFGVFAYKAYMYDQKMKFAHDLVKNA